MADESTKMKKTTSAITGGGTMTEAKLIHTWISDVFLITNESRGAQKN